MIVRYLPLYHFYWFVIFSWFSRIASNYYDLFYVLQVVQEYERAVIFRLGRVVGGAKGPGKENLIYSLQCTNYTVMQLYFVTWGCVCLHLALIASIIFWCWCFYWCWFSFVLGLFFLWPCIDEMQKVDLRVLSYDVPPQEVSILIYC